MSLPGVFRILFRLPSIIRALRDHSETNPAKLFQFAASSYFFPPLQLEAEFVPFLQLVQKSRPSTILEIGTCKGGSLFLLARSLAISGHLISIDLPGGPFGGGFPIWKIPLFRSFVRPDQTLTLLRADSHSPATVQLLEERLGGRALDVLFIDGDHSYEGVSSDYSTYNKYVRPGGMVVLHDIVEGSMAGGVHRLWNELKSRHPSIEFVHDPHQGSCGLGIVWMAG